MRKLNTHDFIEKAISIHGNKYDYSLVEYKSAHLKVKIICPDHGIFEQKPNCHNSARGCPVCRYKNSSESKSKSYMARKYKNIVQPDDYKIIPLTQGKFAIVDNIDFDKVSKFNWQFHPRGYAVNNKKGKMHRFIMDCPKDMQVDHIYHDTLDNRRSNLRICTPLENSRNTRSLRESSSTYKGVSFFRRNGKWRSTIWYNGKQVSLGYFFNEIEAAKAYDKASLAYYKDFSCLNFPELKDEYLKHAV